MKRLNFKKLLQVFIILAFLMLIIRYFASHQEELQLLKNFKLKNILFLIFLTFLSYVCYAYLVLLILVRQGLQKMRTLEWFKIFMISRFINFHITQGANIYRSIILKKKFGFSYTNYVSAVTFLAWYSTLTALLFCCLLILGINFRLAINNYNILLILGTMTIFIFAMPFSLNSMTKYFQPKNKMFIWLNEKTTNILNQFNDNIADSTLIIKMTVVSLLVFILNTIMIYVGFIQTKIWLGLEEISLFTVILTISKYLNIVPGNIGLIEYACGYLSQSLGGRLSNGIIVSGVLRIIEYLFVGLLGFIFAKRLIPKELTAAINTDHQE